MTKTTEQEIEQQVEVFFKRRFPNKNLQFEKDCGYFYEWVSRFESGHPEIWMDNESLMIYAEMQKEKS